MCIVRPGAIAVIFAATCLFANAQTGISDSVFQIAEVRVYANLRDAHVAGATIQTFDSISLKQFSNRTLSDLLGTGGVSIKSYGLGGLSTIALRGGGASHTTIVWNGLNIQDPMNGGINLSLLPVNMFNTVRLQYGGYGTYYGSGAVTGILHLTSSSSTEQPNGVSTSLAYGSANTKDATTSLKWGNKRYAVSIKGNLQKSDNDFEFINTYKINSPREEISNAQAKQWGVMGNLDLKVSDNANWNISGWYQFNDKDLQTLMSSTLPSQANQVDKNLMASSNLKWSLGKKSVLLKNGFINGKNKYSNSQVGEYSNNRYVSIINETEAKIPMGSVGEFIAAVNYTNERAKSDSYIKRPERNRIAVLGSLNFKLIDRKLISTLSARNEMVDGDAKPAVYSLGIDYRIFEIISIKSSISKNYRIPTLNDLYWTSTTYSEGNPNLKPESGWSGEFGVGYSPRMSYSGLSVSATMFWTNIDDLIVWLSDPEISAGKWKPFNLNSSKTYGFEGKASLKFNIYSIRFAVDGFYTYTHSKVVSPDNYRGSEMVYAPEHKFNGTLRLQWRALGISYIHLFTGERYTDATNTLPYFNLGDLSVDYSFRLRPGKINLRFSVNNIWDTNYQLIAAYAMPLRNYMLALTVDINQPKN